MGASERIYGVKKLAKYLSTFDLIASINKTALVCTLYWQLYHEKVKKRGAYSVIHHSIVYDAGISNGTFVTTSELKTANTKSKDGVTPHRQYIYIYIYI